jgi:hypothetical protein
VAQAYSPSFLPLSSLTMPGAVVSSVLFFILFAFESSAVQLTIQRPPPKAASDVNNNLINSNNLRVSRPPSSSVYG